MPYIQGGTYVSIASAVSASDRVGITGVALTLVSAGTRRGFNFVTSRCSAIILSLFLADQVMISNLDYSLTENDVAEFCSTAGAVAGVKLVKKWYAKTSKG